MIEWIKYDRDKPPEKKTYLTIDNRNRIITGFPLGTWWEHDRFNSVMHNVTHYAEINLPKEG